MQDNIRGDLPGFLRELQSTGGFAEAATAAEGLPAEAASLIAFRVPKTKSDSLLHRINTLIHC